MENTLVGILIGIMVSYGADKLWRTIKPSVVADENFLLNKKNQIIDELKNDNVLITSEIHAALDKFITKIK